jgi:FtsH-binding integral membrane protein
MDNNYFNGADHGIGATDSTLAEGLNKFMTKVFGLMFLGLIVTAGAAGGFINALVSSEEMAFLLLNPIVYWGALIGFVVAYMGLNMGINKIGVGVAYVLFFLFSILQGVALSFVLLSFIGTPGIVAQAFLMAAIFFGVMAVFGLITRSDLTSAGRIFTAGLIAIIIASIVNIFLLQSPMLDTVISIAGIAIFAGLTAYDTKKLKTYYLTQAHASDTAAVSKVAIIGASHLYLDFINLFSFLLRFLGRRR